MQQQGGKRGLRSVAALALAAVLLASLALAGCGAGSSKSGSTAANGIASGGRASADVEYAPPEVEGLTYDHAMDLQYATQFDIYYYNDSYKVISSHGDSRDYLIVPEGASVPSNLPSNMHVLQQPLDQIYLAGTSAMALFAAIDGVGAITMSGVEASDWYVPAAKEAYANGTMVYAGKYSQPDYEMFVSKGCDLAVESTMILHSPEVQEQIERLGVPVFIERSSYETAPLGRSEWVMCYAAMLNKEDAARAFFDSQVQIVQSVEGEAPTGKTVAVFSINSDGSVVIRKPSDYIPQMIESAGGVYAFNGIEEQGTGTTMRISMEKFYTTAKDADYLIYNGTIDGGVMSVQDIIDKDSTFSSYKAVQEGHVYGIGTDMYQRTDQLAEQITDLHIIVSGGDESQLTFIKHLN